jgi:hypothetical protein
MEKGEFFSMKNKNLDITPKTMVGDLLSAYPELEDKLIEIAPVFKKLKNPVLRRTIAKVTTLKQASVIANISIADLINKLRKAANQDEITIVEEKNENKIKPEWVTNENTKYEYDARIDLENGIHPIAKVTKEVLQLKNNEIYLLITPFVPAPLIKILEDKGFDIYTEQQNASLFCNYIKPKKFIKNVPQSGTAEGR